MMLKITQVRSLINTSERQRRNMRALGLHRMHESVTHRDSATIRGMVRAVSHLVVVEQAAENTSEQ